MSLAGEDMTRDIRTAAGVFVCLAALAVAPRPMRAQPAPPAAADKKSDPAFEAARTVFEALPESDRRALQNALVWTGDYNSVDSGAFGRRTFEAIVAYQRRVKAEPTGVLDPPTRAIALAAGRKARDAAGFAIRTDAATGAAIGVPTKLLPRETAVPHGTRWQSADGRITLETRATGPDDPDFAATFERLSASTPDRRVTYKLKRPDFLVVTGETPTGRFFIRYAQIPAGLRGFTLSYDKALAVETDKLVIAVANSFDPLPGAAPVAAAAAPRAPVAIAAGPQSGASLTGLEVAPGRLLTSAAALGACTGARLGPTLVRVVKSSAALALVETASKRPAALSVGVAPVPGTPVVVVSTGAAGASVAAGEAISASRMNAPLQPGAAGAPAFDRSGGLVGLVATYPAAPRMVAGVVPPAGYDLVTAADVAEFLAAAGVALPARRSGEPLTAGEVAAAVAPAVRVISCERTT